MVITLHRGAEGDLFGPRPRVYLRRPRRLHGNKKKYLVHLAHRRSADALTRGRESSIMWPLQVPLFILYLRQNITSSTPVLVRLYFNRYCSFTGFLNYFLSWKMLKVETIVCKVILSSEWQHTAYLALCWRSPTKPSVLASCCLEGDINMAEGGMNTQLWVLSLT